MNRILIFCLTAMLAVSCSRNPVTGKRELSLMSESQEKQIGAESDPSIIAEYGLYQDAKLQEFINLKGNEMAKISHRPDLGYKFQIVDSPILNAFAVPGGYVYFTRGIMGHFNNEAEFAGVLGHEIGHITARHANDMAKKQLYTQVGMIAGMVLSETFRTYGEIANNAASVLLLKYSRDNESQSDKLGVEYSTQIGYNSHEMANFFRTLQRYSGSDGSIPTFMSTHPDPGDRYNKVNSYTTEVQTAKGVSPATLNVNRESYLRMIDGLIHGEDPRQGFVESSVFYHPELRFKFNIPQGWQLMNSPTKVQIVPQDGKAIIIMDLAEGTDLNAAAQKIVQENSISVLENSSTPINGLPSVAIAGDVVQKDAQGQTTGSLGVVLYLIKYNNMIYKFTGLSAKTDLGTYAPYFKSTATSFNTLLDPSKLNKLPTLIKIVSAKKDGTLQEALASFAMSQSKFNELSILNGMELTETLKAGTLFKVLEERAKN